MKSKYLTEHLELTVDKQVNLIMRDEKNILKKYSENNRSTSNMLFKDEVRKQFL